MGTCYFSKCKFPERIKTKIIADDNNTVNLSCCGSNDANKEIPVDVSNLNQSNPFVSKL